jgi:hypothetical protein
MIVGCYTIDDGTDLNLDPDTRYLLLGIEREVVEGMTVEQAFDEHWSRLSYNGGQTPQQYRPAYCMNSLSHVARFLPGETSNAQILQWRTLVYQSNNNFSDTNPWFCQ